MLDVANLTPETKRALHELAIADPAFGDLMSSVTSVLFTIASDGGGQHGRSIDASRLYRVVEDARPYGTWRSPHPVRPATVPRIIPQG